MMATPREIRWAIGAAVFVGNDVFEMKCVRFVVFMNEAVFAPKFERGGAPGDESNASFFRLREPKACFRLQDRDHIANGDKALIFRALFRRHVAIVAFLGKLIHARLRLDIGLDPN